MNHNRGAWQPKIAIFVTALICLTFIAMAALGSQSWRTAGQLPWYNIPAADDFEDAIVSKTIKTPAKEDSSASVVNTADYQKIFATVKASLRSRGSDPYLTGTGRFSDVVFDNTPAEAAPVPSTATIDMAASKAAPANAASGEYQGTNVQVEGIDEADIVKTDGKSIFVASKQKVHIILPAGNDTKLIANIDITEDDPENTTGKGVIVRGRVLDMMISGSTLIVFTHNFASRSWDYLGAEGTQYVPYDVQQTKAMFYDISDPSDPAFVTALGQSGSYKTSRLQDGVLYTVSQYTVLDPDISEDDPQTFVPVTYRGSKAKIMGADQVKIMPATNQPTYAMVTAIDISKAQFLGKQAVLGGADIVYMSADNLYLGGIGWGYEAHENRGEKIDGIEDDYNDAFTALAKISLNSGELKVAAQGAVPGTLVNQFALDEYEGNLRVAITTSGTNWEPSAALLVLNPKLKCIGEIPKLVTNETVKSVRFEGKVGYIVTYMQVDPLFAIDLSDPKHPKVMDKLKIPGFSAYMHPLPDGKLLGLGVNATSDGDQNGLKLSIFDTSDPFKLKEISKQELKFVLPESAALTDHRAIYVDTQRQLIGFPTMSRLSDTFESEYLIYHFDTEFKLMKSLPFLSSNVLSNNDYAGAYGSDIRGTRIGEYLYVSSSGELKVVSLADFTSATAFSLK